MSASADPAALAAACRAVGRRVPMWTQGTGGNVSVKSAGPEPLLWIKASGMRLDQIGVAGARAGIAGVRLRAFEGGLAGIGAVADPEQAYAGLLAACTVAGEGLGRPSMETGFHALLRERWVLHFHSLAALLMVHEARRAPEAFERWWSTATPARLQLVTAEKPGWELMSRIGSLTQADVYLLENHGLILQGDDGEKALASWQQLERRFFADWAHPRLLEWEELSPEALRERVEPAAPLRIFFPDTAVFLDRLQAQLLPSGIRGGEQLWRLAPGAWDDARGRDVAEIWLAQQLLLCTCAGLSELPESIAATVASLPLELLRRGAQGTGS